MNIQGSTPAEQDQLRLIAIRQVIDSDLCGVTINGNESTIHSVNYKRPRSIIDDMYIFGVWFLFLLGSPTLLGAHTHAELTSTELAVDVTAHLVGFVSLGFIYRRNILAWLKR